MRRSAVLILGLWIPTLALAESPKTAAPPPSESRLSSPGGAVSLGLGVAYGIAGFQLALVLPHGEPYVGVGGMTFLGGFAAGFRFFPSERNRGLYFSATGGQIFAGTGNDVPNEIFGEAGGGYRFGTAPGWFVQLGAAFRVTASHYQDESTTISYLPDLDAAVGFSF